MNARIQIWLLMATLLLIIPMKSAGDDTIISTGTIYGHAFDADTKQPLSQAWVYCQEAKSQKEITDSLGYYAIKGDFLPSKTYTFKCIKHGYKTATKSITTDQNSDAKIDFYLIPEISKPIQESHNSPQVEEWNKTFGGLGDDVGRSVKQTSDGGYIITGDSGSMIWLIKTDSKGSELWNKSFGGLLPVEGFSVQQTNDGGYILAGDSEYGDFWLIKTDSNGNKIWDKTFGGQDLEWYPSVQQTSDGGYILTGPTQSYGEHAGVCNVWLIKTDVNGNELWNRTFGGSNVDQSYSVQQTSDGGYIITGWTGSYSVGAGDVWLIKTDNIGNELWNRTFGGSNDDYGWSAQQTSDSGYIITGYTESYGAGKKDLWLIKTDANGNKLWDKTFGGLNDDRGFAVKQTSEGGYIVTGYTESYGAGRQDVWLIKTDSNGDKLWDKTFGGPDADQGWSAQQTSDGGYIITGDTKSYGSGGDDLWLIKVKAS